jgi:hypothetical protein
MIIVWAKLLPALVLLMPPIALFHGRRVRYRAVMRDWDGFWLPTLALGLHTIDFARAALGAWWLAEAIPALPVSEDVIPFLPLLLQAAILAIATTLQTLVCKEPEAAHAPFAFVAGLVAGLVPPLIAGFGLLLAMVLALGSRVAAAFFPVLSLGVVGIGLLFTGKKFDYEIAVAAVPAILPFLVTLLFPRHFVSSYRGTPKDIDRSVAK